LKLQRIEKTWRAKVNESGTRIPLRKKWKNERSERERENGPE